jgi:sugar fermentation stimulation protein A
VNTGRANALVEEALRAGTITELAGFTALKREVAYGEEGSRIDFRLEFDGCPGLCRGQERDPGLPGHPSCGLPDAVTQRGAKHLRELAKLARQGCGRCSCIA